MTDGDDLAAVALALKEGHTVRAMVRSANAIRLHDPKLEKLEGDALDQQPRTLSAKVIFFGAA